MVTYGVFFSVLVLLGSAVLRRAAATGAGGNGLGIAATPSLPGSNGASNYAPKEYNKDSVPEKSQKTFADVKGCAEAKAELEEIVAFLKDPSKFTRLGGKLPKGVLLTGPPGTGKTLLAKAVAGEAGVPFFFRAGSEFEEMFVGVGSRRVRALFAAAKKKAPCIVFIDEIDAVGASRKLWENHTRKTLNQLLVEMDGFEANEGIIVMAATNMQESLDAALTRPGRFDRHVAVPLPDVRGRLEILDYYLQDKPLSEDVDSASLARRTAGFSGAELANLVNEAALAAGKGGHARITSSMLDEAQDKILMGSERRQAAGYIASHPSQTAESLRRTAYHESGHALVAIHTAGAHPIHKATIVPRGHALGMVSQTPEKDEYSRTRQQMSAHIDVCMGGRVAEEIIFGADQVTSGARSDFQQATREARHMVTECGMSDEIGPVFVENTESPDMRRRIDGEVSRILREAYNRVTALLTEKEELLHRLAKVLLEHETLTQADIHEVIAGTFKREPLLRPVDPEAEALLGEQAAQPLAEHSSKN
ncbi:ATP-dependent metallopeptidase Hfl [Coccomyxa subellipsoidea C-169]|uniref:ATP-dependent metallopeptidase Hfl n=1 Tax=Coccomyxa subellipsoidea (strain C-169) TaxID=574566 RepID=I0YWZ1_COCSC|nr:ATP-dependent metallopeptidase Hfl [Coccomyxa subellipsoidea C-169]EIE22910.1 ATP-dependent metallopeptidase Hfl [Coccomyxa subellipsoidea C-169]|eukprot:XP_005647454.1 ATP-dependent metallopeptidase Hfl [Coccomyxa subellipsoidea C-169]